MTLTGILVGAASSTSLTGPFWSFLRREHRGLWSILLWRCPVQERLPRLDPYPCRNFWAISNICILCIHTYMFTKRVRIHILQINNVEICINIYVHAKHTITRFILQCCISFTSKTNPHRHTDTHTHTLVSFAWLVAPQRLVPASATLSSHSIALSCHTFCANR